MTNNIRREKIVLYNPRAVFYTMPLGLLAVASALDPECYDVRIIDGRLEKDPIGRVCEEIDEALCLGVSVLTGAPIADALQVLRGVKERRPDIPTICGGWHPSLFPVAMLEEPSIDITVQGQGEDSFREIVERISAGKPLDDVGGIAFRHKGQVHKNAARPLTAPSGFRQPDYSLIPVERFFELKNRRQFDFISSVGCHFRCAFCADPFVYGRRWQGLDADILDRRINRLWLKYRFTDLNFQDETFFTYKRRIAEIAEAFLRRGPRFTWAATMRADQSWRLPEETFRACVESGLRRVLIGVESGSPRIVKLIRKDTTIEQIEAAAERCARYGVAVIFSFIVGFPGETPEDVQMTVSLIKRLRAMSPDFETPIFYYKPYPGSSLSESVKADLPESLDEWATFDYVQGAPGPWVAPQTYRFIERFKFYNRHAWGRGRAATAPLRILSRLRCRFDLYQAPVEKILAEGIGAKPRLS